MAIKYTSIYCTLWNNLLHVSLGINGPIILWTRFYDFPYQRVPGEHFFLISKFSQWACLFRTLITLFGACLFEDIKEATFPNVPHLVHINWVGINLWPMNSNRSDGNAFVLNFLKFLVSTYLGPCLGIPNFRTAKI